MNIELQLSNYLNEIDKKFAELNAALYNQNNILVSMEKTISQLNCELSDLKEHVYKDEAHILSTCLSRNYDGVSERQLDIDDQNFDKAWFLKHYKVDCPEYDQPLPIEYLHNLGCDMTPEQYGKYMESFNDQKVEVL